MLACMPTKACRLAHVRERTHAFKSTQACTQACTRTCMQVLTCVHRQASAQLHTPTYGRKCTCKPQRTHTCMRLCFKPPHDGKVPCAFPAQPGRPAQLFFVSPPPSQLLALHSIDAVPCHDGHQWTLRNVRPHEALFNPGDGHGLQAKVLHAASFQKSTADLARARSLSLSPVLSLSRALARTSVG
eukprot:352135-Chlamydomonas_euryale.AAC.3